MKLLMILLCRGTCAPVATPFKRQGKCPRHAAPHRRPGWGLASAKLILVRQNLEILNAFICNSVFIYSHFELMMFFAIIENDRLS